MAGTAGQIPIVKPDGSLGFGNDLLELLSSYRDLGLTGNTNFNAAASTTEFVMHPAGAVAINTGNSAFGAFYLDPAWWPNVGDKVAKLRVFLDIVTNTVAPGAGYELTAALKHVATIAGAVAGEVRAATLDAALTSVTVAAATAQGVFSGASADVAAPAAGLYVVSVKANQAAAANSSAKTRVRVQQRWAAA